MGGKGGERIRCAKSDFTVADGKTMSQRTRGEVLTKVAAGYQSAGGEAQTQAIGSRGRNCWLSSQGGHPSLARATVVRGHGSLKGVHCSMNRTMLRRCCVRFGPHRLCVWAAVGGDVPEWIPAFRARSTAPPAEVREKLLMASERNADRLWNHCAWSGRAVVSPAWTLLRHQIPIRGACGKKARRGGWR